MIFGGRLPRRICVWSAIIGFPFSEVGDCDCESRVE